MKVVALVSSCVECPHRHYYSGGRHECGKAEALLPYARDGIPAWCPLPEYPAAEMTRLADENASLKRKLEEIIAG